MKKRTNWLKDNRGAALITIMIAVAFVSILASAILYMSYSNFQMKVVNYQSKVNFYGTEQDMTEVSTVLRNTVATASSSDTYTALKTAVGFTGTDANNGYYSTASLASLVYPSSMIDATSPNVAYDGDIKITFSTGVPSGTPNFVRTGTDDDYTVTLMGVIIRHENTQDGTTHKIETDMVFRVKATATNVNPGGIGEFSVLMDSPIDGDAGSDAARTTMYGNVFIGPGTYVYTDSSNTTVKPNGADALVLKGESYYTQKGDYMVVFGNVVIQKNAVLNIMSGRLTVFGDIIIEENGSFLCNGEVYMPEGNKPGTSEPYGIYYRTWNAAGDTATTIPITSMNTSTTTGNVVPATLLDSNGIKRLTAGNYTDTITLLNLHDGVTTNDGILKSILSEDAYNKLQYLQEGSYTGSHNGTAMSYYGVNYSGHIHNADQMNNSDANNTLVFASRPGWDSYGNFAPQTITMQDGANLNSTIISLSPLKVTNGKNMLLSQLGSDVFNMMTAASATELAANYPGYSSTNNFDNTHKLKLKASLPTGMSEEMVTLGSFFVPNANNVVNQLLSHATAGNGSAPIVETAAGYANWVKD